VALAVNYTQVRPDLNADLILTATLVSVLLFDIVASREVGYVVSKASRSRQVTQSGAAAGGSLQL
jgi:hypothetical protein